MKRNTKNVLGLAWALIVIGGAAGCSSTQPSESGQVATPKLSETGNINSERPLNEDVEAERHQQVLFFDSNSSGLTEESRANLDQMVSELKQENPKNTLVHATGFTDSRGSNEYNERLSKRRVQSVMNYLKYDVDANEWHSEYFGESLPVASNTTEQGRQENRRVVIEFVTSNDVISLAQWQTQ